jgi:hypothetical protein
MKTDDHAAHEYRLAEAARLILDAYTEAELVEMNAEGAINLDNLRRSAARISRGDSR